jgi:hypothetical protein
MTIRTRTFLLGVALPLVLLAGSFALMLSWRPRLPDPMAMHWGVDGVDRVGSFSDQFLTFVILSAVVCVPMMVIAALTRGAARRGMVGLSAGMATLMGGIALGTTAIQLDASDAYAVASPGAAIGLPMIAALAVGLLATWLAGADPDLPASDPVPADATRLPVPDGATAVWTRPLPAIPVAVPVVAIGLLLVMAVAMGVLTGDWWLLVVAAVIGAALLATLGWRVRVDRTGLVLTAVLGWPRYRVPADEIVRADVVQVSPFADFGGWGIRVGVHGVLGFVTRTGEAIEVERTGKRRVVVTVDDAARGAALLNTVAERSRAGQPRS